MDALSKTPKTSSRLSSKNKRNLNKALTYLLLIAVCVIIIYPLLWTIGASYTTFAAGAILISIPIVIAFLSLQKHFVSGLAAGGTKG